MTTATIATALDGHVAIVTFARPPTNFADLALIEGIGAAFAAADADPDVRAVVLRSDGRIFCAGADLANANPVEGGVEEGVRNPFYVAAAKLFGVGKPVVAAIQGGAAREGAVVKELGVLALPPHIDAITNRSAPWPR